MRKILLGVIISVAVCAGAQCNPNTQQCDGPAILPTGINANGTGTVMSTTFPDTSGYWRSDGGNCTITDAASLQACVNNAASHCTAGAVVLVPTGTYTFSGTYGLTFPVNNCAAGKWLVVQSANLASLPPQGTRVTSSNLSNMPKIAVTNASHASTIMIADDPANIRHHIWIAGLEVQSNWQTNSDKQLSIIQAGDNCQLVNTCNPSSKSQYSHDIVIDRCYIHPVNSSVNTEHAIQFSAYNLAVLDSYVYAIDQVPFGQDTGINTDCSYGPVKIINNEIIAGSENIIFGGGGCSNTGQLTSDIEIRKNYLHKLDAWLTTPAIWNNVRDWIEFKQGVRALVEGNVFDLTADAGWTLTPRNSGGGNTYITDTDLTFRYNKATRMTDLIGTLGANQDTGQSTGSLSLKRVSIHDNIAERLDGSVYAGGGGAEHDTWITLIPDSIGCGQSPVTQDACLMTDININHNSFVSNQATNATNKFIWFISSGNQGGGPPLSANRGQRLTITNNIAPAGAYGIGADGSSGVTTMFNAYFNGYTFDGNAITGLATAGFGGSDFPSPVCNFSTTGSGCSGSNPGFPSAMTNVGFTNYNSGNGGDYRLCTGVNQPASPCAGASAYHNKGLDGLDIGANVSSVTSYTAGSVSGSWSTGTLSSCTVSPVNASINVNTTQTYTVAGFDQNSNPMGDITGSCTFDTNNHAIATMSGATATATSTTGTVIVTATDGSVQCSSTLIVGDTSTAFRRVVGNTVVSGKAVVR